MKVVMDAVSTSKQAFHQMSKRRQLLKNKMEELLLLVKNIRRDHPRMSARDMYLKLKPENLGRDRFEDLCLTSGFRVKKLKNYRVTTNSMGVTRFPNKLKEREVTGVNQVFVSDITYFDIGPKSYYLTLMMDLYNREVVGWNASESLRADQTTLPALYHLIKVRGKLKLKGAVIHSDGGGQYYSNDFKKITKELKMINSMTQESVYENSHAERLNGTIKNNYLYPYNPKDLSSLRKMMAKAVYMYNNGKPHVALNKLSPKEFLSKITVDNENNSQKSYFPLSTVNHIHLKRDYSINKKVNVF